MRVFLAAALAVFLCLPAYAGQNAEMRGMIKWIAQNSDYKAIDGPLPKITPTDEDSLQIMVHGRLPQGDEHFLDVEATYKTDPYQIYLRNIIKPGTDRWKATILHELVHHLQSISGKHFECVGQMEAEAYRLGDKYSKEVLHRPDLMSNPLVVVFLSYCRDR